MYVLILFSLVSLDEGMRVRGYNTRIHAQGKISQKIFLFIGKFLCGN
jgi:hypothetical protein